MESKIESLPQELLCILFKVNWKYREDIDLEFVEYLHNISKNKRELSKILRNYESRENLYMRDRTLHTELAEAVKELDGNIANIFEGC